METPDTPMADEPMDIEEFEEWAQAAEVEEQEKAAEAEVHALYEKSLLALQEGRWQEAADGLEEVLRQRPDHADAAALLEEARLKASLEETRPTARRALPRLPIRRLLMVVAPIAAVALVVMGVREAYGRWVQPAQAAQEENERRAERLQEAYGLWAERDYVGAEEAFRGYLADYPDSPQAEDILARIAERKALQETYDKVGPEVASRDWEEARSLLTEIIASDARYRDAQELLVYVDEQEELDTWFETAEEAFLGGEWTEAISAYETLIGLDAQHERQVVAEHLFESYLYQGRHLVQSTSGEGEAVREALVWYGKALEMEPQHQRALYEQALAERYAKGRVAVAQGKLSDALKDLQWVYQQEPDYAGGVVAVMLKALTEEEHEPSPEVAPDLSGPMLTEGSFEERFAIHVELGDEAMAAEDHALAEEQYREAATLAVHTGANSAKWLFASFTKLGTALAWQEKEAEAAEALQKAIEVMSKSAVAIPSELYADLVSEGDRYAESEDYASALEQYAEAITIMAEKCDCGLEDWSILP